MEEAGAEQGCGAGRAAGAAPPAAGPRGPGEERSHRDTVPRAPRSAPRPHSGGAKFLCPSRSFSLFEGARDGFGERKAEGWGRDAFPGKALPIRRVSVDKRDLASSSLPRVPLFFLPSASYLNCLIVRGLHALQVTPGEGMGEAAAPSPPRVISILPLTCSSYLGQTGDAGRKTRT